MEGLDSREWVADWRVGDCWGMIIRVWLRMVECSAGKIGFVVVCWLDLRHSIDQCLTARSIATMEQHLLSS